MSLRDILIYPEKRLRKKSLPVKKIDKNIHKLLDDMAETMYHAPGVGLAAPQVGKLGGPEVKTVDDTHRVQHRPPLESFNQC